MSETWPRVLERRWRSAQRMVPTEYVPLPGVYVVDEERVQVLSEELRLNGRLYVMARRGVDGTEPADHPAGTELRPTFGVLGKFEAEP